MNPSKVKGVNSPMRTVMMMLPSDPLDYSAVLLYFHVDNSQKARFMIKARDKEEE